MITFYSLLSADPDVTKEPELPSLESLGVRSDDEILPELFIAEKEKNNKKRKREFSPEEQEDSGNSQVSS